MKLSDEGLSLIECKASSDVHYLVVGGGAGTGDPAVVKLGVADRDSIEDGVPLIVAHMLPSQAIRLARALLDHAGVRPTHESVCRLGNVQTFKFID
jgi:hypothetical protein